MAAATRHAAVSAASSAGTMVRERLGTPPRRISHAVTVFAPPEVVYRRWRDLAALADCLAHVTRIEVLDDRRSHWVAKAPVGTLEWDAEIVEDEPGRLIAWTSSEGSPVPHQGRVRFAEAPGGKGTEVRLQGTYAPLFGTPGVLAARLTGEEPDQQAREDLRRFKAVVECGEYLSVTPQPSGRSRAQEAVTEIAGRMARAEGR